MKTTTLSFPELGPIAGTRVLLGVGIGLLLANRMKGDRRQTAGALLTAIGALSTIPLGMQALGHRGSGPRCS